VAELSNKNKIIIDFAVRFSLECVIEANHTYLCSVTAFALLSVNFNLHCLCSACGLYGSCIVVFRDFVMLVGIFIYIPHQRHIRA